jgi:hypothetical protein
MKKTSVKVTDETVRVTIKFLEEHPEELKIFPGKENCAYTKEAFKICKFLDWSEEKVYFSLERLHLIDEKIIDKLEGIKLLLRLRLLLLFHISGVFSSPGASLFFTSLSMIINSRTSL